MAEAAAAAIAPGQQSDARREQQLKEKRERDQEREERLKRAKLRLDPADEANYVPEVISRDEADGLPILGGMRSRARLGAIRGLLSRAPRAGAGLRKWCAGLATQSGGEGD